MMGPVVPGPKPQWSEETMTITEYINTKTIEALLDNRQAKINGLLRAAQIATGCKCPEGHGESEISLMRDEAYCAACDEDYSPVAAAVDVLHDLGYYDVYAE